MAVAKDSPLAQPLMKAMQKLAANGSYKAAFAKFALPNGELSASDIKIDGSTLHTSKRPAARPALLSIGVVAHLGAQFAGPEGCSRYRPSTTSGAPPAKSTERSRRAPPSIGIGRGQHAAAASLGHELPSDPGPTAGRLPRQDDGVQRSRLQMGGRCSLREQRYEFPDPGVGEPLPLSVDGGADSNFGHAGEALLQVLHHGREGLGLVLCAHRGISADETNRRHRGGATSVRAGRRGSRQVRQAATALESVPTGPRAAEVAARRG